jgi:hypothetical protein
MTGATSAAVCATVVPVRTTNWLPPLSTRTGAGMTGPVTSSHADVEPFPLAHNATAGLGTTPERSQSGSRTVGSTPQVRAPRADVVSSVVDPTKQVTARKSFDHDCFVGKIARTVSWDWSAGMPT